jgi:site-specific recombinase XerD
MIQTVAEGLEWSYGWTPGAAQRLRFMFDFAYATGLRLSEVVGASLGQIEVAAQGDRWLHVLGKGSKAGKVALPPLATSALDRYLVQHGLPTTPAKWNPTLPLVGSIGAAGATGISATRLWSVLRRFFAKVADLIEARSPGTAESSGAQARTGCDIPTQLTPWRAAPS